MIHGESRLFAGNKLGRDSQKEQLELSINQTQEEIKGMEARLAAKEEEIKLVGAERDKLDHSVREEDRRVHAGLFGAP